jgi:Arc/MetJ-type ribon-helix-helix transcriptional regulator
MAETEKITINLSVVDLGQVDLLVEQGFYANRSDFIRSAIRSRLNTHAETVQQAVVRRQFVLGISSYDHRDLEFERANGKKLDIKVVGMVYIANDVTPELALDTIQSLQVFGVLRASAEVKEALADRIS